MEFSGVGGLRDDMDLETDTKKVPTLTLEIIASCHALVSMDSKQISEARILDREVVESGLKCVGFAVMITGDEVLTACHVARKVNIISQPALILVLTMNKKQYEWVSPDEMEIVTYSEEMVEALAEGHDLCIGGDCFEMFIQTCAFVKVIPFVKAHVGVALLNDKPVKEAEKHMPDECIDPATEFESNMVNKV